MKNKHKLFALKSQREFDREESTYWVRATSIQEAILKWTENGQSWHEEKDITSIEVLCNNIDDQTVVYWD